MMLFLDLPVLGFCGLLVVSENWAHLQNHLQFFFHSSSKTNKIFGQLDT